MNINTKLDFNDDIISTNKIANNLTTTSSGYVLDARQGKVLNDNTSYSCGDPYSSTTFCKAGNTIFIRLNGIFLSNGQDVKSLFGITNFLPVREVWHLLMVAGEEPIAAQITTKGNIKMMLKSLNADTTNKTVYGLMWFPIKITT